MTRCGNNPGIHNQNAINSYKVTRWAYNCPSSAQYMMSNVQKMVLGIHYNSGKEKMKDGTYIPNNTTPEYESFRAEVYHPVWFVGGTSDAWQDPKVNPTIQAQIFNSDCSVKVPVQFTQAEFCPAGCYQKDQNLLFFSGGKKQWKKIKDAHDKEKFIVTLSKEATLSNISFDVSEVKHYICDFTEFEQPLIKFTMASGRTLVVTPDHPLIDEQGMIRETMNFSLKMLLFIWMCC